MFNGKAIYNPSGKAGEYSRWACNLYVGCSNNCDYCYCKKGVLGTAMGQPKAVLKKVFKNKQHALEVFTKELKKNADAIRKEGGLFFSFSTDPCLPETLELTILCVMIATGMDVPCSILTKCTDWTKDENILASLTMVRPLIRIGFTITGMDVLERGATVASNEERIQTMRMLHAKSIHTFASVEPVIDIQSAYKVILDSLDYCDMYKIGLRSGNTKYDWDELVRFVGDVNVLFSRTGTPVYWKKSVSDFLGHVPQGPTVVGKDYESAPTQ